MCYVIVESGLVVTKAWSKRIRLNFLDLSILKERESGREGCHITFEQPNVLAGLNWLWVSVYYLLSLVS